MSLTAKIHDDGDSKFSELFNTLCVWLGAAVEKITLPTPDRPESSVFFANAEDSEEAGASTRGARRLLEG